MAGITATQLESDLDRAAIVGMTNTCAKVGQALSSLYASKSCSVAQKRYAKKIFAALGPVFELPEDKFFAATALGGSHPAFILWILAELQKIVQSELSLPDGKENSLLWVRQIMAGALALTENESNLQNLIEQIATPGGCTQEGLNALKELQVDELLKVVFTRCKIKAEMLGRAPK